MRNITTLGMVVVLVGGLIVGCATPEHPEPDSMPQGASFGGLWYSEQFEHMYLHQDGNRVEGVYAYGAGGKLEGEVQGNLLLFEWHEPGDRAELRQEQGGKGFLQLVERDGKWELVGEWGYDDDRRDQGIWEAEFQREPRDGDPRTLEEIRERHH